ANVMDATQEFFEEFSENTEALSVSIENVKETVINMNTVISESANKISDVNDMSAELADDIDELVEISDKNMSNSDIIANEVKKYA
ncbi:MAG: hypothetical protein K6G26_05040, partial [Lachnospiraceae bacterium]|nr:hypothetical protein [Lachnospiraceae bacterium]